MACLRPHNSISNVCADARLPDRLVRTTRSRHFLGSWRCLTSCLGHSARKHGEALACGSALSCTARPCGRDRRQTQTGSDARPLDHVVGQLLCPPASSSRHSPQNLVCLAELSRSHLSDPSLPTLGVPVQRVSSLHLFRLVVLPVSPCSVPAEYLSYQRPTAA